MPRKKAVVSGEQRCKVESALAPLLVPIDRLKPDNRNARKHDRRNLDAVKASLEAFGQQKPIVVVGGDTVIAGNAQLLAAQELGWTHIAAVQSSLKTDQAAAYGIADNRSAELAEWDDETLASLLDELRDQDLSEITGFDPEEIDALIEKTIDNRPDISLVDGEEASSDGGQGEQASQSRFPLSIVLTPQELRQWTKAKAARDIRGDKEMLLSLLEEAAHV